MTTTIFDDIKVIDTDTHVIEPPDLWTSRISVKKWGDLVPHVRYDDVDRRGVLVLRRHAKIYGAATPAMAFWHEYPPLHHPKRLATPTHRRGTSPSESSKMDEFGIHARCCTPMSRVSVPAASSR